MRSLVASSGKVLTVLGIPARKEWQEMVLLPGVQISDNRLARTLLKCVGVKLAPDLNLKTGKEGW